MVGGGKSSAQLSGRHAFRHVRVCSMASGDCAAPGGGLVHRFVIDQHIVEGPSFHTLKMRRNLAILRKCFRPLGSATAQKQKGPFRAKERFYSLWSGSAADSASMQVQKVPCLEYRARWLTSHHDDNPRNPLRGAMRSYSDHNFEMELLATGQRR